MSALHARAGADGSTTPAQRYCHGDLVRLVGDAINSLTLNEDELELAADVDLQTDLRLEGVDIMDVFQCLAERLGIVLPVAMALDLVLAGPTIGRLARVLAERLAAQDAAHA